MCSRDAAKPKRALGATAKSEVNPNQKTLEKPKRSLPENPPSSLSILLVLGLFLDSTRQLHRLHPISPIVAYCRLLTHKLMGLPEDQA